MNILILPLWLHKNSKPYDHNIQLDFIVSGCRKAPAGEFFE